MTDKMMEAPEYASTSHEKARRKAIIDALQESQPEQMKAYLADLEKIRHCYNNGSVAAGGMGGATTYKQVPGCWGYTAARDVNLGMVKRPNWEP